MNTKPFIYGLENGPIKEEIDLVVDYPARLVTMLKNGQIDIGLVPVGALPGLGEYHIVSDYCIGTEGEVASVAVFSEVPMEEIENVYLDYQSRTSVLLCKLLFEKHWKRQVNFIEATDESYIQDIKGKTAGLIIGDRALMNRSRFPHIYDLGLGWKEMTGLPFVFAVWVSVVRLDDIFLTKLNQAFTCILDYTTRKRTEDFFGYRLENYFRKNISYKITTDKKEAIELFLHYSSFTSF